LSILPEAAFNLDFGEVFPLTSGPTSIFY